MKKRQVTVLSAAVVCDACGVTIKAGEKAIVEFDEKTCACRFTHTICPEDREKIDSPRPSNPRNLVRGAVRARTVKDTKRKAR